MRAVRPWAASLALPKQEFSALRARSPSSTSRMERPRKKSWLSATILTIRERRKTSQAVLRVRNGPGRGLSLFHARRRGKAASEWLREKPSGRTRGSICHGCAATARGISCHAGTRTAVLQHQRGSGRGRNAGSELRGWIRYQSQPLNKTSERKQREG